MPPDQENKPLVWPYWPISCAPRRARGRLRARVRDRDQGIHRRGRQADRAQGGPRRCGRAARWSKCRGPSRSSGAARPSSRWASQPLASCSMRSASSDARGNAKASTEAVGGYATQRGECSPQATSGVANLSLSGRSGKGARRRRQWTLCSWVQASCLAEPMTDIHLPPETTGRPHADLLVEIDHVVFAMTRAGPSSTTSPRLRSGKVTAILGGSGCGRRRAAPDRQPSTAQSGNGPRRRKGRRRERSRAAVRAATPARHAVPVRRPVHRSLGLREHRLPLREHTDLDETMIRDIVLMKPNAASPARRGVARHLRDLGRMARRSPCARHRARSRAHRTTSRSPASTRSRWRSPPT